MTKQIEEFVECDHWIKHGLSRKALTKGMEDLNKAFGDCSDDQDRFDLTYQRAMIALNFWYIFGPCDDREIQIINKKTKEIIYKY